MTTGTGEGWLEQSVSGDDHGSRVEGVWLYWARGVALDLADR